MLIYSSLEAIMNVDDGIFLVWKNRNSSIIRENSLDLLFLMKKKKIWTVKWIWEKFRLPNISLLRKREMSTCNMGGFGGKLCHKCPLSNYDNLTLAKWWLMDEENRWRGKTRRRLLFLLLLKSSLLSSQGNFYYCILKMMCIYFREIDVNFAAPIFETFLKWINGALHITFLLNVKFNKSIAALQKSEVGMHFISLIKLHVQ